jgi:hypothetical protein
MPFKRAYPNPATPSATQPTHSAARKPPSVLAIALIVTFGLLGIRATAQQSDPPPNLVKLVAHRESETEAERNQYLYRQTVSLDELDDRGAARGHYREVRDVIFSPQHERTEELIGKPDNTLAHLVLTPEDFADIRDIQPVVLTEDRLWNYEATFRGDETVDGIDCWVLQVKPRGILSGQRLFDGMIWVEKKELNIVRLQGQAVPQIRTLKSENLFPRFTTVADDTLQFRIGPQRERLRISYSNYKRFSAESTFTPK